MDQKLKTVMELCRDPMLAVKKGKIEYANSAARASFFEAQEKKNAVDLIPREVLSHEDDRYSAMTVVRGKPCCITCCDLDGTRVFMLQFQDDTSLGPVSGGMLANLSGNICNLQIVAGQLSSRFAGRDRDAGMEELLNSLQHSYYSLKRQVGNLSLFYQLQTDSPVLNHRSVDLVEFCENLAESVNMLIGEKGARVEFTSAHSTFLAGMDTSYLERVLLNLLSNSIAHTKREDGSIRLGLSRSGDSALFSVDDRGEGIPEEMQKDIFARYRLPLSAATLDRGANAGLGLAVVGALVRYLGGAVFIRSKLGEGTSVHVTLPFQNELTLNCNVFEESNGLGRLLCELSDVLDNNAYSRKYLD